MDDEKDLEATPELLNFLNEPMTRGEVVQLVQPLRSALLPVFHGAMTSLALVALHGEDEAARHKAKKAFEELRTVFDAIDLFDKRMDRILSAKSPWASDEEEATNE